MSDSLVTLYNQALSAAGTRGKVSLPTEASREADLCNLWYETIRDSVLGAAFWPSCRKHVRLSVLAERNFSLDWTTGDPSPIWRFAYAAPSDMLRPRYLTSFQRFSYELHSDSTMAIMANEEKAILQYTFRQDNVDIWDSSLRLAMTYTLGAHMCMPLHAKPARAKELLAQAQALVDSARVITANQMNERYESVPTWIAARGYGDQQEATVYLYPYDQLQSIAS